MGNLVGTSGKADKEQVETIVKVPGKSDSLASRLRLHRLHLQGRVEQKVLDSGEVKLVRDWKFNPTPGCSHRELLQRPLADSGRQAQGSHVVAKDDTSMGWRRCEKQTVLCPDILIL